MQSPTQSENQRDSYRYPIDSARQGAQMRFAGKWTPIELLDESAGGFGVLVESVPEVAKGDVVGLRCGGKSFEVEVMHVTHCSPSIDSDEPACKLGLRRVSEVFEEADAGPSWMEQVRSTWQRASFSLNGKGLAVGLGLAFFVGVLPAVIFLSLDTNLFGGRASDSSVDDGGGLESLGSFSNPFKMDFVEGAEDFLSAAPGDAAPLAARSLNERQKAVWQLLLDRAKQQTNIEPWGDAVLALIANLAVQMSLTDLQQAEVGQLLKYTDRSLVNLDAAKSANEHEAIARKRSHILERSYIDLMRIFSAEQQTEWNKLVEERDGASKAK